MSRALFLTALLAAAAAIGCQATAPTGASGEDTQSANKGTKTGKTGTATPRPTLAPKSPGPTATARVVGTVPTPNATASATGATPTPAIGTGATPTPAGSDVPSPTPTPVTTFVAGFTSSVFAGGLAGAGEDGVGAAAKLGRPSGPAGMEVEHGLAGVPDALYFCDPAGNQIRRALLADGAVSRVAGATRDAGIQKDVNAPAGLALNTKLSAYNLFFTEPPRSGIYRQPRPTQASEAGGAVSEVAGFQAAAAAYAEGLGVDDGAGGARASLKGATGLVLVDGTIYVADTGHHTIRTMDAANPYTVGFLAGGKGVEGQATADADRAGARFKGPTALAIAGLAPAQKLIVADTGNHCIRAIDLASGTGRVTLLAGKPGVAGHDDGAAGVATFDQPIALAVDPASGAIFVGELGTPRLRKIAPDGTVTTVSGNNTAGLAVGTPELSQYTGICGLAADVVAGKLVALYAFDRGPAFESAGQPGPRLIKLTPP